MSLAALLGATVVLAFGRPCARIASWPSNWSQRLFRSRLLKRGAMPTEPNNVFFLAADLGKSLTERNNNEAA